MSNPTNKNYPGKPLNQRQMKIYDYIIDYTIDNLYQPSYREIVSHFGWSGKTAISQTIRSYRDREILSKNSPIQSRALPFLVRPEIKIVSWPDILEDLTDLQTKMYRFIIEEFSRNFYQPSTREITQKFGFKSLTSVRYHLKTTSRQNLIVFGSNQSRAVRFLVRPELRFTYTK